MSHRAPPDHGHRDAELAQQQRDLHPDQAVADDQGRPRVTATHPVDQVRRRAQRLEVEHTWQVGTRQRRVQPAARRRSPARRSGSDSPPSSSTARAAVSIATTRESRRSLDAQPLGDVRPLPVQRAVAPGEEVVGHRGW